MREAGGGSGEHWTSAPGRGAVVKAAVVKDALRCASPAPACATLGARGPSTLRSRLRLGGAGGAGWA